jgi:(2Fe-2S) ferredoxin
MPHHARYLFVCTNRRSPGHPKGSCAEAGSEELVPKLKAAVAELGGKGVVRACASGCLDLCEIGAAILQEPEHVAYGHVTDADLHEIAAAALRGEVVTRLVVYPPERATAMQTTPAPPPAPEKEGCRVLGFTYREELHGGLYFLADPFDERAADLLLDVEVKDITAFAQSHTAALTGPVTVDGFAKDARGEGKLVIDADQKRATYEVSFTADDGVRYRFRGHKELSILNVLDSFTLVRASLYDTAAREIGRAVVRFDARGNWASLLRSIRLLS